MKIRADVKEIASQIASSLRERGRAPGRASQLPSDVVETMRGGGLYRLCLPRELGGLDVGVGALVGVVESIAKADGSAGWCIAVANASASLLGALDRAEAELVASDAEALCVAGGFAGTGRAVVSGGALDVSGRWSFASGCTAATWFLGGVRLVDETGQPSGPPRVAFFPSDAGRIVPNWDVAGLRATGSHDIVADGVTVPVGRTCELTSPRWSDDPVARIPFFTLGALSSAAVVVGIAERALEEVAELARTKVRFGRQTVMADDEAFQAGLTHVTAGLRAARAYLFGHAEVVDDLSRRGALPTEAQADAFLVAAAVRDAGVRAALFAHEAGGTSSIREDSPIDTCLQDVLVATRHVGFTDLPAAAAGRVLLGKGPQPPILT